VSFSWPYRSPGTISSENNKGPMVTSRRWA
jgi:hypothetical protein